MFTMLMYVGHVVHFQLRTFRKKYAEVFGHFATLAKIIGEEISVRGASRDLDEKLIYVCKETVIVYLFHIFSAVLQATKLQ